MARLSVKFKKERAKATRAAGGTTPKSFRSGGSNFPGGGRGGGTAAPPPTSSKFEALAKSRGVDLPAEQARARSQLETGQRVGGTTASTLQLTQALKLENLPTPSTQPFATRQSPNPDGSFQYETPDGVLHHVSATGVDTVLESGTAVNITASDITSFALGVGGLLKGALAGILAVTAKNTVRNVLGVAVTGAKTVGGTAGTYAVNTVTAKVTMSLFAKLGLAVAAAGTLFTVIGSYPFAGFLKEEALQTLGFGVNSALNSGNIEGAQIAIDQQKELLNPEFQSRFLGRIPFANVLDSLEDFYTAARIKLSIDEQRIEDLQLQQGGETEDERWTRIRQKEVDQDKAAVDYYNDERKKMINWETEARAAAAAATRKEERKARNKDAAFWASEREKQREKEAADRQAIADFWMAYRKATQKAQEDSRPSNLNFGLL